MTETIQIPKYFYGFFNQEVAEEIEVTKEKKEEILARFPVTLSTESKGTFKISDYQSKQKFNKIILLLSNYTKETASNGNPFLKINFINGAGKVAGKVFDNNGSIEGVIQMLEDYSIFEVTGDINEFMGNKSLNVKTLSPFEGDLNPSELIPVTEQNMEDMIVELVTYLEDLAEPFQTAALKGLERFWSEFSIRPAAMGHHHAYLSGLVKHVLGLTRLAVYLTKKETSPYQGMLKLMTIAEKQNKQEMYNNLGLETPVKQRDFVWNGSFDHLNGVFEQFTRVKDVEVNADLLICAILFHDIGKILEYTHAGEDSINKWKWMYPNADFSTFNPKASGITMDPIGGGTGHIPLGIMMMREIIISENIVMKIEDIGKLNQCLAAHHGKLEWGSAAWMQEPEAFLIHFVDYMDSRWEKADPVQ